MIEAIPVHGLKLVTAICLTRNRREYLPGAIADFQAQDYWLKELVVLDDSDVDCFDLIPGNDPAVRYFRLPADLRSLSIGRKRNAAIELARGQIICHFDDDDIYLRRRISEQVEALECEGAQVTGYRDMPFRDVATGRTWMYTGSDNYVVGVSLCYFKSFWEGRKFSDVSIGEDNAFIDGLVPPTLFVQTGAQIIARIHPGNTNKKSEEVQLRNREYWREIA